MGTIRSLLSRPLRSRQRSGDFRGRRGGPRWWAAGEHAGILIAEQFGAEILRDPPKNDVLVSLPVEKIGQDEFQVEYDVDSAAHIAEVAPIVVKASARYHSAGESALDTRQTGRLLRLSDGVWTSGRLLMLEAWVPPTDEQFHTAGSPARSDEAVWPGLMTGAITTLQGEGDEPDFWWMQGLGRRLVCQDVVATARRSREWRHLVEAAG
ncbi:MAG: DUF2090 domain-containing protein [Dehalococcoidia bacterium]